MSVFCLLMGLSLNFKFKWTYKVLKALNEPVAEIRANEVSRREHGNEGPLANDDYSPKEGSGLFQLKECHQMHTLVFSFLLINIEWRNKVDRTNVEINIGTNVDKYVTNRGD